MHVLQGIFYVVHAPMPRQLCTNTATTNRPKDKATKGQLTIQPHHHDAIRPSPMDAPQQMPNRPHPHPLTNHPPNHPTRTNPNKPTTSGSGRGGVPPGPARCTRWRPRPASTQSSSAAGPRCRWASEAAACGQGAGQEGQGLHGHGLLMQTPMGQCRRSGQRQQQCNRGEGEGRPVIACCSSHPPDEQGLALEPWSVQRVHPELVLQGGAPQGMRLKDVECPWLGPDCTVAVLCCVRRAGVQVVSGLKGGLKALSKTGRRGNPPSWSPWRP